MSDKFENDLRDHLHKEAEEIREFPRRLRGRIREGIAPRARARMAPQLALAGALVLVASAVLPVPDPAAVHLRRPLGRHDRPLSPADGDSGGPSCRGPGI